MTISTTTQIAGPVDVRFQQQLLRNAKALAVYFIGSEPGRLSEHEGTFTVKWRRIENLTPTTTALTALTGTESYPFRAGTAASVSDTSATLSKYGQVYALNEEVDLINFNGQTSKLVETLSISAGRSLNRLQRNILEDNVSSLIYAGDVSADGDVGDIIDLKTIRNAVNRLQNDSALKFRPMSTGDTRFGTSPTRPAFVMLSHVDVEEDVRDISSFIKVEQYAGHTATFRGEYGMVHGVRCISSEEASVDASSGAAPGPGGLRTTNGTAADLYTSVIYGLDAHGSVGLGVEMVKEVYQAGDSLPAIQLIQHNRGSAGAMDPLNEIMTLAWKAWHSGAILNSAWLEGVRSGASKLS